ncbi:DEAD/DEAH box helicase [Desulfobulbus rhabdoformis]|uniref:DEAD/DEAH box helicase n=1 Tax=Desulfobulbus rhabdoformis TaxID=34032 RepID=UPI00196673C0|nr:DEAD/DEAH box helicase [Desulfobulbus rhabdoformis]MBM9616461.1 DEAD/DEAH box helicase [Desulfobulbus rhabdoformis]
MPHTPKQHQGVAEYIQALKGSPRFGPQVVHHQQLSGRKARFGSLKQPLPPALQQALKQSGYTRFFSHQQEAIDRIRAGEDVIVATPTASGKSLIYNVPVLESVLSDATTHALYLFPLKALAQDQLRWINEFSQHLPELEKNVALICDGDTSDYKRRKMREKPPNILITNPDMLHLSMLGYNDNWSLLWQGLRYIIIDEVHTYRGVFGSHMAWVMRRLIRICKKFGVSPQFILSSATVGNPAELAHELIDREVAVVSESGAPRGQRHFIMFDPIDSAAAAACQMLEASLKRGLRTIVYTQARKMTELIYIWTRDRLGDLSDKLTSYRAGFLPEERREIEERLTSGNLLGVISTSALELGIDIGSLDICILVGYPGTIMATWQRGGRVGRRQRDSLIIMVGQEDALDQYFLRHPQDFFEREVESAVLNPSNPVIAQKHLLCAATESPLRADEAVVKTPAAQTAITELVAQAELLLGSDGRTWFSGRKYPHRDVDLRGSGRSLTIRVSGKKKSVLGQIDGNRALKECHPGAIYLHRGETYLIEQLDLDAGEIRATRKQVNYFTRTMGTKETEILATQALVERKTSTPEFSYRIGLGRLKVTDQVTGFQRRLVSGHRVISTQPLELPPTVFETEGLWIEIPARLQEQLETSLLHFMGGIHALEHAAIGIFPLLVLCDRNDIGGISYPLHPQLKKPAVFIYDGQPGGVGLSREAFHKASELLASTLVAIASCPCETGCPSCVHSPKCGSGNRPIDKEAAHQLLLGLGAQEVSPSFTRIEVVPEPKQSKPAQQVAPEAIAPSQKIPKRYGVFDIETQKSAAEVGGWNKAEKMLVSVAVVYDAMLDDYLVFREGEVGELIQHLQSLELVVGFNNKRFDNQVLNGYGEHGLATHPTVDILEVVKNQLGYRLSLNNLAENTLGVQKSADGLMALKWYRQGRIDKIITYCTKDVEVTRDLFLFGLENRYLLFKNKAGSLVRCPVDFTTILSS